MGSVGSALGQIFTGGLLGGQTAKAPRFDERRFDPTPKDKQQGDPNRGAALKEAEERRRRLAAARGRQNLRVDLAAPSGGAGISIRGRGKG
jgi:hypothetical protein